MQSVDKYLFQAMDNYPYSLEETIESLEYALSCDPKNTTALCLYARVQAEQLFNYEGAKSCFQEALGADINAIGVYPHYIQTLLWNEDFDEAQKLIDFALTVKGINKYEILTKQLQLFEINRKLKKAKKVLKKIKLTVTSNEFQFYLEETQARLKDKTKIVNPKKKKKKKAKSKNNKKSSR